MKAVSIKEIWKDNSKRDESYVTVIGSNGHKYVRKIYEKKNHRFLVFLKDEAYTFIWNDENDKVYGEDIKWEYSISAIDAVIDENADDKGEVIPEVVEVKDDGVIRHEKYNHIKTCIENDIPVYLVGPAGSGKNHTLEQIADDLGLDFYFTNSVQQEFKLTGFIDAGGVYHETEFYKAFKNGGLFFLDEMDASIPEVLVLLNAAIANRYFEFPNGRIEANEEFRVVAAGNTMGNGADEQYQGRMVLDQATLDRFAVIEFDYDSKVELHLAKGNKELVNFIHNIRTQAANKGIRSTFSYRCISMVTKLENKLSLTDLMVMVVFKGLDKDTIRTFNADGLSKYGKALKEAQGL